MTDTLFRIPSTQWEKLYQFLIENHNPAERMDCERKYISYDLVYGVTINIYGFRVVQDI